MTIPKSYEALSNELSIWKQKACEAAEREAALREELERVKGIDHRQILAESAAKYLIDRGAENFIGDVFTIESGDGQSKFEIVVTTQKIDAKSPGQLYAETLDERDALQQRLTVAEQRAGDAFEIAAKWIENRCDEYVNEHGSHDPETGAVEFPGSGEEYVGELTEIAEGLRALKPPADPESLGTRPVGCCCPPKGHTGIWAAAMCPVHFGLKRPGVSHDQ